MADQAYRDALSDAKKSSRLVLSASEEQRLADERAIKAQAEYQYQCQNCRLKGTSTELSRVLCQYHSGEYMILDLRHEHTLAWSCCRLKGFHEPGCKLSRVHQCE